jgi:DNA-binding MarR family transcriptional regulator
MKLDSFDKMHDMPAYLLRRAGQLVTSTHDAETGKLGITASQVAAFLAIHVQPGMQQRELAAALSWDEATVGGMVRRLEAQGLIERRSSPRSRRGREIYMTEAGEEFYKRVTPHVAKVQKNLLKAFTPDERDQLMYLLSKMLGVSNSYYAAPAKPTRKSRAKSEPEESETEGKKQKRASTR